MKYNPSKIEKRWQRYWETKKFYVAPDKAKGKDNFYFLVEFPYPSGNLHIGHWYRYSVSDILARRLRMNGKNVMYPIGFDAFGLPAENAAIKNNLQPEDWTRKNIAQMTKQLKSIGATFDWSRVVSTIDPDYYKWTQWIFLQFYKKGLAYRAKTLVNWCPKDKTVLANEQVINGCCDRCGADVVQKELAQWMYKITDYADRLIDDLGGLDWPEATKIAQRNWIGRSQGAIIRFTLAQTDTDHAQTNAKWSQRKSASSPRESATSIEVFTTRADTLFGTTYLVLAPEHPLTTKLTKDQYLDSVGKYLEEVKKKSERERVSLEKEKTGVFTGAYAINPINNEKIPIWVADYVIGWYGTGAVMAVPSHDTRDWTFAEKYNLPKRLVVAPHTSNSQFPRPRLGSAEGGPIPPDREAIEDSRQSRDNFQKKIKAQIQNSTLERAYEGEGVLVSSGEFTGFKSEDAREEIVEKLAKKKLAQRKTNYKLHDWVLSRQRYWGTPIPMINCPKCGYKPASEKDLPVKLPKLEDYKPSADGRSPLAKAKTWLKVKCPACGGEAERETDTMDTFVDSSWYFLRYADPKNKKTFADPTKMEKWLPVDMYVGGAEHNTMHLLYSRFFIKAMHDLGLVEFSEPFTVRRNGGIILGPDNQKMSKSRGNVIDPDEQVKKYGADAVRMYLAFMGPYEQGGPWNPTGINGVSRFLNRVWNLFQQIRNPKSARLTLDVSRGWEIRKNPKIQNSDDLNAQRSTLNAVLHRAIKKIGEDIETIHFNTGVSELMKLLNVFEGSINSHYPLPTTHYPLFLKLLAPFAPHLTEELWQQLHGQRKSASSRRESAQGSIHEERWPEYDPKLIVEETVKLVVQINGKTRDVIDVPAGLDEAAAREAALMSEKVKKYIAGHEVKKVIYVPDRLINLVI